MILICFILIYSNCHLAINGLVVTDVTFLSSSGKNYVLTGEPFTISCIYHLEQSFEKVQTLEILLDDSQVYLHDWGKEQKSQSEVFGVFKGTVDLIPFSPSSINVKNATIAMYGNYTCKVKSQISCSSQSNNLVVINDACRDSDWTMSTNSIHCNERVGFDCVGMFPKPSPSCGVYEQNSGRFITAEPLTLMQKQKDGTYRLSMTHVYNTEKYRDKRGLFLFRCILSVIGTTWSREINSQLFTGPACTEPPSIPNGYHTVDRRKLCWNTPVEGSIVTYKCSANHTLTGNNVLICFNGSWRQVKSYLNLTNTIDLNKIQFMPVQETQLPTCNSSSISSLAISLIFMVTINHLISSSSSSL